MKFRTQRLEWMCERMTNNDLLPDAAFLADDALALPLEVRVHGRGGQGGVTCAKLIAALYTQLGLHVQTFGDYGSERSGAPIQAYTRVDRQPITNRNKVYRPDHLLVLDEALLGPAVLSGTSPGALLLLNSRAAPEAFADEFADYRFGVVDATAIAREHGIGSSAVVIINTTLLGAYVRLLDMPFAALERAFAALQLSADLAAAQQAYAQVQTRMPPQPRPRPVSVDTRSALPALPPVLPTTAHCADSPVLLKTGTWSTQAPHYREQAAPCNADCPAGNDVRGFIQALKNAGPDAAAEVLLRTQALPSVCGRVCPAPCMQACNREAFDGAVNVRSLERWIADHTAFAPEQEAASPTWNVAVVGGGPAGLSAAWQLARRGHAVTIHEAGPALGGVLRNGIPAYRLPPEALQRDVERILRLGVTQNCNARLDADGLRALRQTHDALIVCTGFGAPLALGAEGETLPGVEQGLAFLERARLGPVELRGRVIVVGGGNSAIDCARTALRCGASSVKLVYRRGREDMPAIDEEIDAAEAEGMRLELRRQPVAFLGHDRLASVVLAEVDAGPPDASGRRRPVVTQRTTTHECDTVLLALGQNDGLDFLPDGWQLREARAWQDGAALNVWFAGDCARGEGTVTHAIGSGRRSVERALAALAGRPEESAPATVAPVAPVAPGQIGFAHFAVTPPHRDKELAPSVRRNAFDECNQGLSGPEEADRCFSCGQCTHCDTCLIYCPDGVITRSQDGYAVDAEYCKGCGMCVAECPRSAMEMNEKAHANPREEVSTCH